MLSDSGSGSGGLALPKHLTLATRALQATLLVLVLVWVHMLGGLAFRPRTSEDGAVNDTGGEGGCWACMRTSAP